MKILKIAFALLAAAMVILLAYATTKPDVFRVERSTIVKASPDKIFPLVNDFHQWTQWSPYEKLDPAMQRTYGGADSGKGATYAWQSEGKAGSGRMEIVSSEPVSRIGIDLQFIKPFETRNVAEFTFQPVTEGTRVAWSMQGPNPYIAKVMQVIFDLDTVVGKDFESGLAALKTISER